MPRLLPFLTRASALLAAAVLCAILANAFARPDRKLEWTGWVPPAAPQAGPSLVTLPLPAPQAERPSPPSPRPAGKAAPTQPAAPRFPPDPAAVKREITSKDAWDAFVLHVPFLDARRTPDYEGGHVPGAWSVAVWESGPEARITEFEARANPGPRDPIVIYCSGGGCEDSHLLAGKLVALGYRNLLIYTDGFPDWAAQSRPVEKGARR